MIFQYAQLGATTIRLLHFHSRSTISDLHVILEHQTRYSAEDVHYSVVSHEPNMPDEERKSVTLNGRTRMIDLNAWDALTAVWKGHRESQRFFLESLCVNHGDTYEVKEQIGQLPSIYASADEVLLWLDSGGRAGSDERDLTRQADTFIRQAANLEALRNAKRILLLDKGGRRDEYQLEPQTYRRSQESL